MINQCQQLINPTQIFCFINWIIKIVNNQLTGWLLCLVYHVSSSVDCCMFTAELGRMVWPGLHLKSGFFPFHLEDCQDGWKNKVNILLHISYAKTEIWSTHLIFVPKTYPLPLTFNEIEENARSELAGSKMARSSQSIKIRRFLHWAKVSENGLFFC